MIDWLLKLFPQYRDLAALSEAQARNCQNMSLELEEVTTTLRSTESDLAAAREANESLTAENVRLQDRLDAAIEDKKELWDLVHTSLDGERFALHTQVNHAVQRAMGSPPYPDANILPTERLAKIQPGGPIGRRSRILPSEAMARQERENYRQWAEAMVGAQRTEAAMVPEE
jgi:hypothetical protein